MTKYLVSGDRVVGGVEPGGIVDEKDVITPHILIEAGLISPLKKGIESNTMKAQSDQGSEEE